MKYNPPKGAHIPQADYDLYKDVVTAGYRFHDLMLGRILDFVDDDTYLMIVSDPSTLFQVPDALALWRCALSEVSMSPWHALGEVG